MFFFQMLVNKCSISAQYCYKNKSKNCKCKVLNFKKADVTARLQLATILWILSIEHKPGAE